MLRTPRPLPALAAALVAAAPFAVIPSVDPAAQVMEFHAIIDGAHARIPTSSLARGIGRFTLNEAHTQLAYEITFDPWVNNEVFSHIHVDSAANNGQDEIVFDFDNGNPKVGVYSPQPGIELDALLSGHLYVNVHTTTFQRGEIAGYILPGTPAMARSWGRLKALYRGAAAPVRTSLSTPFTPVSRAK